MLRGIFGASVSSRRIWHNFSADLAPLATGPNGHIPPFLAPCLAPPSRRWGERCRSFNWRYYLPRDPFADLRYDGVSCSESLHNVGCIQSEAQPISFRRSLPLSHLIPCVRFSDESGTAQSDLCSGLVCQQSIGSPCIRLTVHWRGVSQQFDSAWIGDVAGTRLGSPS